MQLQLENGEIKKYSTWYSESKTEYSNPTYKTKCGMVWDKEPSFDVACSHIDCAIEVVEREATFSRIFSGMSFIVAIWFVIIFKLKPDVMFIFSIIYILVSIFLALNWYFERKVKMELIEFRDHGTIKGIKAQKV